MMQFWGLGLVALQLRTIQGTTNIEPIMRQTETFLKIIFKGLFFHYLAKWNNDTLASNFALV